MNRVDVEKALKEIIIEVTGLESGVGPQTDLVDELGIDSFTATEILVAVEQRFGVQIEPSTVVDMRLFKDMTDLLSDILEKKNV